MAKSPAAFLAEKLVPALWAEKDRGTEGALPACLCIHGGEGDHEQSQTAALPSLALQPTLIATPVQTP